jgi:hypothetical protein
LSFNNRRRNKEEYLLDQSNSLVLYIKHSTDASPSPSQYPHPFEDPRTTASRYFRPPHESAEERSHPRAALPAPHLVIDSRGRSGDIEVQFITNERLESLESSLEDRFQQLDAHFSASYYELKVLLESKFD